jgi:hypothetical protein
MFTGLLNGILNNDKGSTVNTVDRYSSFGDLADTFKQQGWQPERWNNDFTDFRSKYGLLNDVVLPEEKDKGYISIRGNKNGMFDLVVKKSNGEDYREAIAKGLNAQQVNDYFTHYADKNNAPSVINQRTNQLYNDSKLGLAAQLINK